MLTRKKPKTARQFHHLSEPQKQAARQAFIDSIENYPDDNWWQFDDFVECARLLGIEIGQRKFKTVGGRIEFEPEIFFSGFSSQGDGASFDGTYDCAPNAVKAIAKHAPGDQTLKDLAEQLTALQICAKLRYGDTLSARITSSSSCSHSGGVSVSLIADFDNEAEADWATLQTLMRRFADWMYRQLSDQYDWYFSNECIDEQLAEKEFDEHGAII